MKIMYFLGALCTAQAFAQEIPTSLLSLTHGTATRTLAATTHAADPRDAAQTGSCLNQTVNVLQSIPFLKKDQYVKLPFEYANFDKRVHPLVYLPENFYTILEQGDETRVLVGPCRPCTFIGLRHPDLGKTVVANKQFSGNLDHLIAIAKEAFGPCNFENLEAIIWSVNIQEAYTKVLKFGNGTEKSWKHAHEGRTQIEELKKIKDTLLHGFGIEDRTRVRALLFTPSTQKTSLNPGAPIFSNIIVDRNLISKSYCWFHENFFSAYFEQTEYLREKMGDKKTPLSLYTKAREHLELKAQAMYLRQEKYPSGYGTRDFYHLVPKRDFNG